MNELREELDRTLRALPVGEAPVERARRDGRRLRVRRRVTLLAGALAVAAVAAGYPALARSSAMTPATPLTGTETGTGTGTPSASPSGHDPLVTDGPALPGAVAGDVAQGTVGDGWWQVLIHQPGPGNPVPADPCVSFSLSTQGDSACTDLSVFLSQPASNPGAFTFIGEGATEATIGEAADDVDYFVLTFTDGQQLKLIPVTVSGERYVAWVAPDSMTVARVVAHLGSANFDSGETSTAVPFEQPGQPPMFGLWQAQGEAAAPRAEGTIGAGTADGRVWSAAAYEGPWGTCFVPGNTSGTCVPVRQLTSTEVLGGWVANGSPAGPSFGSAAPGVAMVKIKLSNGKSVEAKTAAVGNEHLFAFWTGDKVTPVSWTAYSAAGKQAGTGTVSASSVIIPASS
ncbi:MAG TPA: hypothetical protein VGM12_04145 [Trebonia sp.]